MIPQLPPVLRAGERYEFTYLADTVMIPGRGLMPEVFAPGAFDRAVGAVFPLRDEPGGRVLGHVRLLSADVADDGLSAAFACEVTDVEP